MARGGPPGPRPRHVPVRTCVACRQERGKRDLVRVVRAADGGVRIDPIGKVSGRGAYICQTADCWRKALKENSLPRALKLETIPPEDLKTLVMHADGLTAPAGVSAAHDPPN